MSFEQLFIFPVLFRKGDFGTKPNPVEKIPVKHNQKYTLVSPSITPDLNEHYYVTSVKLKL